MQERERTEALSKQQLPPEQVVLTTTPALPTKDEHTPAWIKIFGGSIVSILFLCIITVMGYFINNMSSLQSQITQLNSETITKREYNERLKSLWEPLSNLKERTNAIEQLAKERNSWMEKNDARLGLLDKSLEAANKELVAHKERISLQDQQLKQYHEENRTLQKDLQSLRERVAALEAANKKTP